MRYVLTLVVVFIIGGAIWWLDPLATPEERVRARLAGMIEEFQIEAPLQAVGAGLRARAVRGYLTEDVSFAAFAGYPGADSRQKAVALLGRAFGAVQDLTVQHQVETIVMSGARTISLTMEVEVYGHSRSGAILRERGRLRLTWSKQTGSWKLARMEVVSGEEAV